MSASDEARLFIERVESISKVEMDQSEVDPTVERAVEAYAGPFFEAVRMAMVQVGDIATSDYELFSEVRNFYPSELPQAVDEHASVVADISERARHLLTALSDALEKLMPQAPNAEEMLSVLMLIVKACERVHFEQRYG